MGRLPLQVQIFLYRRARSGGPLFLLLKRRGMREGFSFWQGVTGAPEPGESLEDAARREVEEETGLRPTRFKRLDIEYTFPVAEEWKHLYDSDVTEIREFSFLAEVPTSEVRLSDEHLECRWVRASEALAMLFWPENKTAFEEAIARVSSLSK